MPVISKNKYYVCLISNSVNLAIYYRFGDVLLMIQLHKFSGDWYYNLHLSNLNDYKS